MTGRDGAERFPQAAEPTLEASVTRALRRLDPSVTLAWVQDVVALHDEREVLKARDRTLHARPADVRAFFQAQFRGVVAPKTVAAPAAAAVTRLRTSPTDDPYGF
jgi:hypothetical protein